jgi:excisionase family DNA binding protein
MVATEATRTLWLTVEDLAERWDLPVGTIRKFCASGKVPRRVRFGKRIRFHIDDVLAWEHLQREAAP